MSTADQFVGTYPASPGERIVSRWTNWSGRVNCSPDRLHRPASEAELEQIIQGLDGASEGLRVVGSGHSFTPLTRSEEHLVSLENLTGVVDVDKSNVAARVRAGTTLSAFGQRLHEHDLAMRNLGDIDRQTLAGAISTGTHGTGINHGILATQVEALTILTPAEGRLTCSETRNPDVFKAAQVSLGALGILTELTLNLEPAYNLREVVRKMSLEDCLNNLGELKQTNRHAEFFWFPGTETVLVKTLNPTEDRGTVPDWTAGEIIENGLLEAICYLGSTLPVLPPVLNRLAAAAASSRDRVGPAHKIFPSLRSVRFNEMEYGVPEKQGTEAFQALVELINRDHPEVQFPVEFRYVAGDDIPLSPAYGGNRVFLAVHKYHRKPCEDFLRDAEGIFREYNGRPHWAKIHYLRAKTLKQLYPEWNRFQAVRHRLDPSGLLMNDYLEDLFIP